MTNITKDPLDTPVYLKEKGFEWPKDKLFYLMTADGLMICRNHTWFKSCAPAKKGPSCLEKQEATVELSYPAIPRVLMEKAVGFFHKIYQKEHWESALILAFNRETGQMELVCPDQKASWVSVKYEIPELPPHLALIGDLHSHGSMSPKPSMTDTDDELKRPGLHIVVGWINEEPPNFYCAAVVDGQRFEVDIEKVIDGYEERVANDQVPKEWTDKVEGSGSGGNWELKLIPPNTKDLKIVHECLARFSKLDQRPSVEEVRQEIYIKAMSASYRWCLEKAEGFVKDWKKK